MLKQYAAELLDTKLLIVHKSCIYFNCVFQGSMEGLVWVDSIEAPTFAVVWNEYQKGFQVVGKPIDLSKYNSLRKFFDTTISNFLMEKGIEYIEIGADTYELAEMLRKIFYDKKIESEQQKVFKLKSIISPTDELTKIIENKYEIIPVNQKFFKKGYNNLDYVTQEILITWGTIEKYLESGYGYAAVFNNNIISRSIVTCSYNQYDNIGVDTLADYRKQGVSTILVYKTLLEADSRRRICIWDCMEDNTASERTALKVGFKKEYDYTVIWFKN